MQRRKFVQLSALTAITLQSSFTLSGCGSGSKSGNNATSLKIDDRVQAISSLQATNDILHTKLSQETDSLLSSGESSALFGGFAADTLSLKPNATDLYFSQKNIWDDYQKFHSLSYKQVNAQLTKLKATLRLYEYNHNVKIQNTQEAVTSDQPQQSPAVDSAVETFLKAVEDFKNLKFGAVSLDGLELSIKLVYVVLEQVKGTQAGEYMLNLVLKALQSLLTTIEQKALSNIDFSSNSDTVLSIAKVAVAIISVQGLSSLGSLSSQSSNLQTSMTQSTQTQDTQTLLESLALQSKLIMTLVSIVNAVMNKILSATQTLAGSVTDPSYQLSAADTALIASLKPLSTTLGLLGLIIKALLTFYQNNLATAMDSGAMQGDAQNYTALFGSPINAYETQFSQFTSDNFDALFASNPTILALLNELGISNKNFSVQTDTQAQEATAQAEATAFDFASTLANPSYQFSPQTTTVASDFATHLADLAYQFVMKIEDDAYTFAMKGMEYGYLFASKGEEVGLMADRILWMAVQIGAMADRIGEMADRIVYTEQLIVYTEMLILDFGILIYSSMKQISNFMLMGMAIIFDREWYSPSTADDPVLNIISDMTQTMLENMQEYEHQVLNHQTTLRKLTLKALDWIDGQY